jgi:imidazolonepropionase-like amidohydrolase
MTHRHVALAVLLALSLVGCRTARAPSPGGEPRTLVVRGTLVQPDGSTRRDAAVIVEGQRIVGVGAAASLPAPSGAQELGGPDKWIVPGLVDAHVHLFQSGGLYTRPDIVDLGARVPYAQERAAIRSGLDRTLLRYLRSGVTTVLDAGGPMWNFDVRERAARSPLAPRVLVAGPLLASVSRPQLALDDPPIVQVTEPERAREIVREQARRRPDLVKLWWIVPQGGSAQDWLAVGKAAIEEAHAHGIRVAVHATELETARAAVAAGADVLVHSVDDAPIDDALLVLLREREIPYITTLVVLEGYREALLGPLSLTPAEREIADPFAIASILDAPPLPERPGYADRVRARLEIVRANAKRAQEAGVLVVAGSDAGNIGTFHGPALLRELELLVESGLRPAEALRAATESAARALRRERDLGTVEAGKLADLLVLDASPLEDIRNVARLHAVVKDGVVHRPDELLRDTPDEAARRTANEARLREREEAR